MQTFKPSQKLAELRKQIHQDAPMGQTEIRVGMGTCSISVGAREVMHAILEAIDKHKLNVRVTTTGCQGFCSEEPLVQVTRPGESAVTYRKMDPQKVPALIERHIIEGHPITEWILAQSEPHLHAQTG